MPTLINAAVVADTNIPFVWTCSECGMVFALDRITRNPTTSQLQRVNSNFSVHCDQEHPTSAVVGLTIPKPKEDASQAAARIVREATKG
jgi:glucose dehydrogenase